MKIPNGANRIWLLRCQNMMTQEDLAREVPCSREYISQIERGLKQPSLPMLERLAELLHFKRKRVSLLMEPVTPMTLRRKKKDDQGC